MYIFIMFLTIIGLFGLNRLQKGLFRDLGFLWLVIIDLRIINIVENKDIFNYLILVLFGMMVYVVWKKQNELVELMIKKFKKGIK